MFAGFVGVTVLETLSRNFCYEVEHCFHHITFSLKTSILPAIWRLPFATASAGGSFPDFQPPSLVWFNPTFLTYQYQPLSVPSSFRYLIIHTTRLHATMPLLSLFTFPKLTDHISWPNTPSLIMSAHIRLYFPNSVNNLVLTYTRSCILTDWLFSWLFTEAGSLKSASFGCSIRSLSIGKMNIWSRDLIWWVLMNGIKGFPIMFQGAWAGYGDSSFVHI